MINKTKKGTLGQRDRKNLIFYCCMLAFPILQLSVFYIYVNFNSIVMSFQKFDVVTNKFSFNGFENYIQIFKDFKLLPELEHAIKNSFVVYIYTAIVGMVAGLLFAYYIFKKRFASTFFKVVLYSPAVISSVVIVTMFLMLVEDFLPAVINKIFGTHLIGFLNEDKMKFPTLIIYSLWIGLGTQILLYLGAMNNISDGVLEAAQLDGVSPIREFFSIVLPQIFPTITVFVCTGLSSIFINQLNLYTFYVRKADPELYTVGYYMYRKLVMSTSFSNYPYVAAMGILVTLVTTPTVLLVRKLLNRVDPMGG